MRLAITYFTKIKTFKTHGFKLSIDTEDEYSLIYDNILKQFAQVGKNELHEVSLISPSF